MNATQWKVMVFFILLSLGGCGKTLVKTQMIRFEIDDRANLNHPIAVDLVAVYDPELLKQIVALPASEWFNKRSDLKKDYPASLLDWEWEFVPDQQAQEGLSFQIPSEINGAQGLVLFAKYIPPGNHRERLDRFEAVKIHLQEKEFSIAPIR